VFAAAIVRNRGEQQRCRGFAQAQLLLRHRRQLQLEPPELAREQLPLSNRA
jgi:hypothetical protein